MWNTNNTCVHVPPYYLPHWEYSALWAIQERSTLKGCLFHKPHFLQKGSNLRVAFKSHVLESVIKN